jgi:predicted DNA-binding protein
MKKKLIKEISTNISAVIPAELYQALKKYAEKHERTFSYAIKKSLTQFLEKNENK